MSRKPQRLFLALWPGEVVRAELAQLAAETVEHPVPAGNLHITLVFLGASSQSQRECISDAMAHVCGEPFEIKLDYLGGFPKSRIQWLGCQQIPPVLLNLVKTLQASLSTCGYDPETRRYAPHITLSRKIKQPIFQVIETPIYWRVEDFVLVESFSDKAGVGYRVCEKWGLGNAGSCV